MRGLGQGSRVKIMVLWSSRAWVVVMRADSGALLKVEATEFQAELICGSHLCPYTEDKDRGEK